MKKVHLVFLRRHERPRGKIRRRRSVLPGECNKKIELKAPITSRVGEDSKSLPCAKMWAKCGLVKCLHIYPHELKEYWRRIHLIRTILRRGKQRVRTYC